MDIAALRDLARAECLAPANRFGPAFFEQHLEVVVAFGGRLARRLGADPQVVESAGYLHDLAAVRDLACVPTHHLEGAAFARSLLAARGWPARVIEAVARCVAAHSAPVAVGQGTLEEVCLSSADVLAQIARPAYWFYYLHGVRGVDHEGALAWFRARVEGSWNRIPPEARALAAAEHAIAVRLLGAAGGGR